MAAFHRFDREENRQALAMFTAAFERDPEFASAYAMAARCYAQRKGFGWIVHPARENTEALRLAREALESLYRKILQADPAGTSAASRRPWRDTRTRWLSGPSGPCD